MLKTWSLPWLATAGSAFLLCSLFDSRVIAREQASGHAFQIDSGGRLVAAAAQTPGQPSAVPKSTSTPGPRWFHLQAATFSTRHRYQQNSDRVTTANHLQYGINVRGAFTFDRNARVSLIAGVATGNGFSSGWNATGLGTGTASRDLNVKQLYLLVTPAKGVQLSYGSMTFVRGEATEATTIDNDGYFSGGRIALARPVPVWFDEVDITLGYVGDFARPNFFRRTSRFDQWNYQQYLVERKFGTRLALSLDYTHLMSAGTARAAARIDTRESRAIDWVRIETYQGLDGPHDFGYTLHLEKAVIPRLAIGGGWADIDPAVGALNGDRFSKGRRVYGLGTLKLPASFTLQVFGTRAISNSFALPTKIRTEIVLTYDALKALQRRTSF